MPISIQKFLSDARYIPLHIFDIIPSMSNLKEILLKSDILEKLIYDKIKDLPKPVSKK